MNGMLLAEAAILAHFETIGVVFLVLDGIIIALLAFGAGQYNLNTLIRCHVLTPPMERMVSPRVCRRALAERSTTATHILGQTDIL
jgi:hypothetical protein